MRLALAWILSPRSGIWNPQENVGRLQIAVQHAVLMSMIDGAGDAGHEPCRIAGRQRAVIQSPRESLPRHELHGKIRLPGDVADFVDLDDIRVDQPSGGFGLGSKSSTIRSGCQFAVEHQFERDDSIQRLLPGFVDDAHSTAAQLTNELIIAEWLLRFDGRKRRRLRQRLRWASESVGHLRGGPKLPQFIPQVRILCDNRFELNRLVVALLAG